MEISVIASFDDCYRRLTPADWSRVGAAIIGGKYDAGSKQQGGGMRFQAVTLPNGCIITAASLKLISSGNLTGTTCNTRISAEDAADPPLFADDAAAFDARWANRTATRVDWDNIGAWTTDDTFESVDISAVIQELVDSYDYSAGDKSIVIFWEDYEDRSTIDVGNPYRQCKTWDVGGAAILVIEYIEGPQRKSMSGSIGGILIV